MVRIKVSYIVSYWLWFMAACIYDVGPYMKIFQSFMRLRPPWLYKWWVWILSMNVHEKPYTSGYHMNINSFYIVLYTISSLKLFLTLRFLGNTICVIYARFFFVCLSRKKGSLQRLPLAYYLWGFQMIEKSDTLTNTYGIKWFWRNLSLSANV